MKTVDEVRQEMTELHQLDIISGDTLYRWDWSVYGAADRFSPGMGNQDVWLEHARSRAAAKIVAMADQRKDRMDQSDGNLRVDTLLVAKGERQLREMLADLQREYQTRAAPIVKALCELEALRPAPRFLMEANEFAAAQLREVFSRSNISKDS